MIIYVSFPFRYLIYCRYNIDIYVWYVYGILYIMYIGIYWGTLCIYSTKDIYIKMELLYFKYYHMNKQIPAIPILQNIINPMYITSFDKHIRMGSYLMYYIFITPKMKQKTLSEICCLPYTSCAPVAPG